jgi:superfamily I DNA/RNA helicase
VPLRPEQIQEAEKLSIWLRTTPPSVRVLAEPGTGKSAQPASIIAVSFTRTSTMDLQKRIEQAREDWGLSTVDAVAVSTVHSLALRTLRAGALEAFPADPTVLG